MIKLLCALLTAALLFTGCAQLANWPTDAPTPPATEPTHAAEPTLLDERLPVEGCGNAWYIPMEALNGMGVPEFFLLDGALFAYSSTYTEEGTGSFVLKRISLADGAVTAQLELPCGYATVQAGQTGIGVCDQEEKTVYLLDFDLKETARYPQGQSETTLWLSPDLSAAYVIDWSSGVERVELETGARTPVISNAADVSICTQGQTALVVSYMDRATQRSTSCRIDLASGQTEALPLAGVVYSAVQVGGTWMIERAAEFGRYAIVTGGLTRWTERKNTRFELLAPRAELLEFDEVGAGMTLYDCDGRFLSRCALPETVQFVARSIVWCEAWNGYLLLTGTENDEGRLVLWDPTVPGTGSDLLLEEETIPDGVSAAPELYERAAAIGEQYGLDLRIADRCVRDYDSYDAVEVSDSDRLSLSLDILEAALADYPEGYFRQLLYGNVQSIRVELIGELAPKADAQLGETAAAFAQELQGEYLVVFDVYTLTAGNVYHEFTHVTDRRLAWDALHREDALFSEEAWAALNPEGFSYGESYEDYPEENWQYASTGYFVSEYSMTYPTEDRATMFEMAMNGDLLAQDYWAPLREKLRYYSACIRDCLDTTGWPETTNWETVLQ